MGRFQAAFRIYAIDLMRYWNDVIFPVQYLLKGQDGLRGVDEIRWLIRQVGQ